MSDLLGITATLDGSFLPIVVVPLFVIAAVAAIIWQSSRSQDMLDTWARNNGYEILERESRSLFRGPFCWTSSRGQAIYYVKVRDQQGTVRSGWVRCGSYMGGLWSEKVEARWDD